MPALCLGSSRVPSFASSCLHICTRAQCHVPRLILVALRQRPRVGFTALTHAPRPTPPCASPRRSDAVASRAPPPAVYATSSVRPSPLSSPAVSLVILVVVVVVVVVVRCLLGACVSCVVRAWCCVVVVAAMAV